MLDLKMIAENKEKVEALLARKGCVVDFTEVLGWDNERKQVIYEVEGYKAEKNKVSA